MIHLMACPHHPWHPLLFLLFLLSVSEKGTSTCSFFHLSIDRLWDLRTLCRAVFCLTHFDLCIERTLMLFTVQRRGRGWFLSPTGEVNLSVVDFFSFWRSSWSLNRRLSLDLYVKIHIYTKNLIPIVTVEQFLLFHHFSVFLHYNTLIRNLFSHIQIQYVLSVWAGTKISKTIFPPASVVTLDVLT